MSIRLLYADIYSRTDSVGVLVPNTECRLVSDDGREVAEGEPGEIYIRGPQTFQGYWRNDQATQETKTAGGWVRTGDLAIARLGEFRIVDRKKVPANIMVYVHMLTMRRN